MSEKQLSPQEKARIREELPQLDDDDIGQIDTQDDLLQKLQEKLHLSSSQAEAFARSHLSDVMENTGSGGDRGTGDTWETDSGGDRGTYDTWE